MRIVFIQKIIDKIRSKKPKPFNIYSNQLGKNSYIGAQSIILSEDTTVGNFCSIADRVIIGPGSHPKEYLSTHPFMYLDRDNFSIKVPDEKKLKYSSYTPCTICNDVWVGINTVIMDGVTIHDGAIIGSNSVITKDVPPYAIVVGANRIVGYRFSQEIIKELLELKWWDLPYEYIVNLPFKDIEDCISQLKEIRKSLPCE